MRRFDRIYLSPHLDDAVFSCAGRIWTETREGLSVLIATVATAGPPGRLSRYARRFHERAGLGDDAIEVRRREDREAGAMLGAEVLHLGLPDAVYRLDSDSGKPLYPRLTALLGRPHSGDALGRLLRPRLGELPDAERLLVPWGLGGHVDHRITRAAAEAVWGDGLLYWEDFPYLLRRVPWGPRGPGRGWRGKTLALSEEAVAARCRAMAAYGSQVRMVFGSEQRMRRKVERALARQGGERLWRAL